MFVTEFRRVLFRSSLPGDWEAPVPAGVPGAPPSGGERPEVELGGIFEDPQAHRLWGQSCGICQPGEQACPTCVYLVPSITNYRSSPKLMTIESVMPSSHLILCCPLPLLPPILPSKNHVVPPSLQYEALAS